jgi:hypothetical protein
VKIPESRKHSLERIRLSLFTSVFFPFSIAAVYAASPAPTPAMSSSPNSAATTSAAPTEISVPCTTDGSSAQSSSGFLRGCTEVIEGNTARQDAPKGMLTLIDQQARKEIDGPETSLYRGTMPDGAGGNVKTGKPVCVLLPNEFNRGQPEIEKNHLGDSCGLPSRFEVHTHSGGFDAIMKIGGDNGVREFSYLWGLKAQSRLCHWKQVTREIRQNKKIKVSPYCDAQASALVEALSKGNDVVSKLKEKLGSSANLQEIWKCDPKTFGTANQNLNLSNPMQAAQYLCSARTAIEGAFVELAMCEIEQRSDHAFRHFAATPDLFIERIKTDVGDRVRTHCSNSCGGCKSYGCCNRRATSCTNRNYLAALENYMSGVFSRVPNDGNCTLGQEN